MVRPAVTEDRFNRTVEVISEELQRLSNAVALLQETQTLMAHVLNVEFEDADAQADEAFEPYEPDLGDPEDGEDVSWPVRDEDVEQDGVEAKTVEDGLTPDQQAQRAAEREALDARRRAERRAAQEDAIEARAAFQNQDDLDGPMSRIERLNSVSEADIG